MVVCEPHGFEFVKVEGEVHGEFQVKLHVCEAFELLAHLEDSANELEDRDRRGLDFVAALEVEREIVNQLRNHVMCFSHVT